MLFDTRILKTAPIINCKGMVSIMRTFGETLSLLREEKGLSRSELAKALKTSPATLGKMEEGTRSPTIPELVAIGNYFNVSYDYMLGCSDNRISPAFLRKAQGNERLASIIQLLGRLPEDRLEAIWLVLKDMDFSVFVREQVDKGQAGKIS